MRGGTCSTANGSILTMFAVILRLDWGIGGYGEEWEAMRYWY